MYIHVNGKSISYFVYENIVCDHFISKLDHHHNMINKRTKTITVRHDTCIRSYKSYPPLFVFTMQLSLPLFGCFCSNLKCIPIHVQMIHICSKLLYIDYRKNSLFSNHFLNGYEESLIQMYMHCSIHAHDCVCV